MKAQSRVLALLSGILALTVLPARGADLTFALDASTGSGSASARVQDANPPCLQPSCILFTGTLTDTDTDSSLLLLESLEITISGSSPSIGLLSADNSFVSDVPGILSGDPNFASDNSGNPPNVYSGPLFGIDIAPGMLAGVYSATVTIHAAGGSGDPNQGGFIVTRNISITITAPGQIAQVIAFSALTDRGFGATPVPVNATASSGLPVTLTSNTTAVCTVSGATLSLVTIGTCSITATQAGNPAFSAADPVTQTFAISPGSQTINFPTPATVTLPTAPFTLNATSSSGLPVAFASTTAAVCTVSGSTLTPLASGACSITATQAGNVNYIAATPVTQSFAINAASSGGGSGGGTGGGGGNPLTVSPAAVTINAPVNGPSATQTITLSYQTFTQGAPAFTANFNTNQGQGWLNVSPASGTLAQASFVNFLYTYTATITISANPAGIAAGSTYTGTVNFNSGGGVASESVTMNVIPTAVPQPTGGIANAASAGQATPSVVAPGSYVAIYGTGLAGTGNPSATALPLPFALNGTQVTLCGVPAPLLYASTLQINALLPQNLPSTSSCPMVVTSGSIPSAPVQLAIAELQPGIYTVDTSGSGAGIVTNATTGVLNDATHPAHASDFLVIYATGLGTVQGPNGEQGPADGVAAPTTTIFHTTSTVTASIGGAAATVTFAGLTPTFAGLYQVNIQVPAGVAPGSAVKVVLFETDPKTAATAQSNAVTIVVQ